MSKEYSKKEQIFEESIIKSKEPLPRKTNNLKQLRLKRNILIGGELVKKRNNAKYGHYIMLKQKKFSQLVRISSYLIQHYNKYEKLVKMARFIKIKNPTVEHSRATVIGG